VQGVWFRASTREQAVRLGLSGRADNLPDGRVEVVACGSVDQLARLEAWLWKGPDLARVDRVDTSDAADEGFDGFATGRREG
jgi:acylphosphatase